MTAPLEVWHEAEVTPDQIDHLGHMNVMFYGQHARAGADRLLASIGVAGDDDQVLFQRDSTVRHLQEQLVGAPLAVRGGVLDATDHAIRLYQELVNRDSGALAATFVPAFELVDRTTRRPQPLAPAVGHRVVSPPAEGLPRTIAFDQDPTRDAPDLATLAGLDLAMQIPRVVEAERCNEDGFLASSQLAELVWGGQPVPGREFRPLADVGDGVQLGFATLESRATWARPARAGQRIQSFGAQIDLRAKTMVTRHWVIDLDDGQLVAVLEVVGVAFDTARRRAIEIPDPIRQRMARGLHPELAGPAPA